MPDAFQEYALVHIPRKVPWEYAQAQEIINIAFKSNGLSFFETPYGVLYTFAYKFT